MIAIIHEEAEEKKNSFLTLAKNLEENKLFF